MMSLFHNIEGFPAHEQEGNVKDSSPRITSECLLPEEEPSPKHTLPRVRTVSQRALDDERKLKRRKYAAYSKKSYYKRMANNARVAEMATRLREVNLALRVENQRLESLMIDSLKKVRSIEQNRALNAATWPREVWV